MVQSGARSRKAVEAALKRERTAFAMKVRAARAILGWSQTDLAERVGMTQRAIHRIEQGDHDPMRSTVVAIEQVWRAEGIEIGDHPEGGITIKFKNLSIWDRRKNKN